MGYRKHRGNNRVNCTWTILNKDGSLFALAKKSKCLFYLKKELAKQINDTTIQLLVVFDSIINNNTKNYIKIKIEDKCVVCGQIENLSSHHVIPVSLLSYLPRVKYHRFDTWTVEVCNTHHREAEDILYPVWTEKILELNNTLDKTLFSTYSIMMMLFHLKKNNSLHKLKPHILETLLKESTFNSIENIPTDKKFYYQFKQLIIKEKEKIYSNNIRELIKDFDSVENIEYFFKNCFLKLQPKFLPDVFLQHLYYENENVVLT